MDSTMTHEVENLNTALNLLEKAGTPNCRLVEEHTFCARACRLGAMPGEYEKTLSMARKAANHIKNDETKQAIIHLLDDTISTYRHSIQVTLPSDRSSHGDRASSEAPTL